MIYYIHGILSLSRTYTLTRSPDRGLFLGRVGNVSSFGFVSIAQYEP